MKLRSSFAGSLFVLSQDKLKEERKRNRRNKREQMMKGEPCYFKKKTRKNEGLNEERVKKKMVENIKSKGSKE